MSAAAGALLLAACAQREPAAVDRFTETGELIALSGGGAGPAKACFSCHGLDGRGDGAGVPRLAGLNFGYLQRQLEAYADGRRTHPVMEWTARHLSPDERKLVSNYYATMRFVPGAPPASPAPRLYVAGDPARGLPACAACHGLAGQGIGPANPPLGAQPAPYLLHQLEQWRHGKRRNDPLNVMVRISQLLTPSEAASLADYASALPGGSGADPPNPVRPVASREGRRSGPRNGV